MYKYLGILMLVLALVVGIVPVLTDCLAHGRQLETVDGMSVPMKCHWTAIAEMAAAVPLGLAGIFTATSRRRETRTTVSLFGMAACAFVLLIPTVLIGVCANPMMPCNMVEKPLLLFCGILASAASLGALWSGLRMVEQSV
jgi:hypothetical protein